MADDDEKKIQTDLDHLSIEAALNAACHPIFASRFELVSAPLTDFAIIAFGGAVAGVLKQDDAKTPFKKAQMHAAYLINKSLAIALVEKLNNHFGLDKPPAKTGDS